MRKWPFSKWLILAALLALPILALSQAAQQNLTLIVNGRPGVATVVQLNGRSYVEIEALARIANGSLSFKGNQIMLTLPASTASAAPASSDSRARKSRILERVPEGRHRGNGGDPGMAKRPYYRCPASIPHHGGLVDGLSRSSCQEPHAGIRGQCQRIRIETLQDC